MVTPKSVSKAVSRGSVQTLLSALSPIGCLHDDLYTELERARDANEEARLELLCRVLPIVFLTNGDISLSPNLRAVLARIRANLNLLLSISSSLTSRPPFLNFDSGVIDEDDSLKITATMSQARRELDHFIASRCDPDDLRSVNMLLSQRVTYASDHLLNAWNAFSSSSSHNVTTNEINENNNMSTIVSSVTDIPLAVRGLRARANDARRKASELDVLRFEAACTATSVLHEVTRRAVSDVEVDTAERSRDDARDLCHVTMLEQRGKATAAKLRLVRAECAARMYTPERVEELDLIGEAVRERISDVSTQLAQQSAKLAAYRALGPDFTIIVQDYLQAKSRLEQLAWSRRELGLDR